MADTDKPVSKAAQAKQDAAAAEAAAAPVQAVHKVLLQDVLDSVNNFFARHPGIDRALLTDLSSGLTALERYN